MDESLFTVTTLLIATTCLVTWLGFKSAALVERGIFNVHRILNSREYYRLLSSGFFHANIMHLLFNMISLYFLGSAIEGTIGAVKYLIIYFSGIIGGNLLSLFLNKKQFSHTAYGASGGVSSIIFAAVLFFPENSIFIFPIPLPIPLWLYAFLFLGISAYAFKNNRDNIGHDAHLGGSVIGLLSVAVLCPSVLTNSPTLFTLLFFMSLALFIYITYNKGPLSFSFKKSAPLSKPTPMSNRYGPEKPKELNVDKLLDKISQKGIHSLGKEEKDFLEKQSRKKR